MVLGAIADLFLVRALQEKMKFSTENGGYSQLRGCGDWSRLILSGSRNELSDFK